MAKQSEVEIFCGVLCIEFLETLLLYLVCVANCIAALE